MYALGFKPGCIPCLCALSPAWSAYTSGAWADLGGGGGGKGRVPCLLRFLHFHAVFRKKKGHWLVGVPLVAQGNPWICTVVLGWTWTHHRTCCTVTMCSSANHLRHFSSATKTDYCSSYMHVTSALSQQNIVYAQKYFFETVIAFPSSVTS